MKQDNKKNSASDLESKDFRTRFGKQQDDEALPGYPHYPESEDILDPQNAERVPVDVENISPAGQIDSSVIRNAPDVSQPENDLSVPASDADLTTEDFVALGEADQDMDMGEDENLIAQRGRPLDMTGEALDVPGAELDDANEEIGEEDEENNFYSRPD